MKRVLPTQSIHTAIPYLLLGLILLIQGIAIYLFNDGKLVYNLDDPYIHLSLARNIAHGHYGINLIEPSAPSSSILWPFILAIFARLPLFEYMPLILNIVFGGGILYFVHKTINLIFQNTLSIAKKTFFISLFIIIGSITPLIWSGMEHLLQILLAVIILYHLLDLEINNRFNRSLLVAVIINALVRYENLAICIPVLLFIYLKGHRQAALISLVLTIAPLVAFSYFLHRIGLGYLPTSVIIKGAHFSNQTSIEVFFFNIWISMQSKTWYFLVGVVILLALKLRQKTHKLFILIVISSIVLQLLLGTNFGLYYRYETYIIVYAILAFLYLYKENIPNLINSTRKYLMVSIALISFIGVYFNYRYDIIYTPMMSSSIYLQQYQMAIFTSKYYNKNVGVNDLGLVAYMNNNYTLDLFGLSNIDVIDYRKNQIPGWMNIMSDRYNVDLIMIYNEWFVKYRPSEWIKIGELRLNLRISSAAHKDVDFYVRNPDNVEAAREIINQFRQTLPKNAEFIFTQE